jgi:hypothetical protein
MFSSSTLFALQIYALDSPLYAHIQVSSIRKVVQFAQLAHIE